MSLLNTTAQSPVVTLSLGAPGEPATETTDARWR
jgi:hypothetical protein